MKAKHALFFLIFAISIACHGQKIFIHGEETSRKLKWSDFTGPVDKTLPYFANTGWKLKFRYANVQFKGEAATVSNFEVTLELDPDKTWLRPGKESDELLVHEQGHFDIGIICMNEILSSVAKASLNKNNYTATIQNIVRGILAKYKLMGDQYDQETNHSINKEQQKKWNDILMKKLSL